MDFYPHEWLSLTGHMTPAQKGIFINICALIYAKRGKILNDPNHIARVSYCSLRLVKSLILQLSEMGDIQINDGFISQKRCENELKKKKNHLESSASGGRNKAENLPKTFRKPSENVVKMLRKRSENDPKTIRKQNENEGENIKNNDLTSRGDDFSLSSSYASPSPSLLLKEECTDEGSVHSVQDDDVASPPTENKTRHKKVFKIIYDFEKMAFEHIPENLKEKWSQAYPAVDINAEIKIAEAWIFTNPKRIKSNYNRFLNTWLSKKQDKGGSSFRQENAVQSNTTPQERAKEQFERMKAKGLFS